jgi:hypothetical protein
MGSFAPLSQNGYPESCSDLWLGFEEKEGEGATLSRSNIRWIWANLGPKVWIGFRLALFDEIIKVLKQTKKYYFVLVWK